MSHGLFQSNSSNQWIHLESGLLKNWQEENVLCFKHEAVRTWLIKIPSMFHKPCIPKFHIYMKAKMAWALLNIAHLCLQRHARFAGQWSAGGGTDLLWDLGVRLCYQETQATPSQTDQIHRAVGATNGREEKRVWLHEAQQRQREYNRTSLCELEPINRLRGWHQSKINTEGRRLALSSQLPAAIVLTHQILFFYLW